MNKITEFKVISNGPLQVSGKFELYDSKGKNITKEALIFLCRCGQSSNKPFCDGAHKSTGFSG